MPVSKVKIFEEVSTPNLKRDFFEEWERVSSLLIRVYPLSDESLNTVLKDLIMLYEELKRREEPLNS